MDRLAENQYKLDITKGKMKQLGFKYDHELDDYVYRFPVYEYNRVPVLFCKLGIDEETGYVWFNVYDNNGLYMPYYNREYGNNSLIPDIEEAIQNEFKRFGVRKVA